MNLWDDFKKVSAEEWMAQANIDLKGKMNAADLKYIVDENLSFSPFLTAGNVPPSNPVSGPVTIAGSEIGYENDKNSNINALKMLSYGAQALALTVDENVNFDTLFDGIYLDMIKVVLKTKGNNAGIREKLQKYLKLRYAEQTINIWFLEPEKDTPTLYLYYDTSFSERIRSVKAFNKACIVSGPTQNTIVFVELKKDFLAQISELRAIRKMWEEVREAQPQTGDLIIIAGIHKDSLISTEVHPLIVTNYLLMSAYMGMCDIAFGLGEDQGDDLPRLSLNIQHIMSEESKLTWVTDPMAGSYIIEKMTQDMISLK